MAHRHHSADRHTPAATPARAIILIGLRASGKSTAGARAAAQLAWPFIDLDDRTAARLNAPTVSEAFSSAGEPAFRAAEAGALAELLHAPLAPAVVSLGGGTPTAPGAADLLRAAQARGDITIIYLRASVPTLKARLARTDIAARPPLTGAGTIDEVQAVFDARDPLYTSLASQVIDTDAMTTEAVMRELVAIARAQ